MLRWPQRALGALVRLFNPLQDVDVYVEDTGDEVFYSRLLQRLADGRVRVIRAFAAGNRQAVIDLAHQQSLVSAPARRCVYLIDGDFEWVLDRPAPKYPNLYRLPAYCIENFLVDEAAATGLLMEELVLDQASAGGRLQFGAWLGTISKPLVEMFAAFATLHHFDASQVTVSRGVGKVITSASGCPRFDAAKANQLREEALRAAEAVGGPAAKRVYEAVLVRANQRPQPLDIVSGKDFLLPLLDFALQRHSCKIRRKTLRHRLASRCSLAPFAELGDVIAFGKVD